MAPPLPIHIVVKGLWQYAEFGSNIIFQYTYIFIFTNGAKELTPCRFEIKPDISRIRKDFFYSDI